MANFTYDEYAYQAAQGTVNLLTDELRTIIVMVGSSAGTDRAAQTVGAITNLNEFDGAGYTSGGKVLANPAVARDPANNGAKFDSDDVLWTSVSPGTGNMIAALVIKWVTNLNSSIPIGYYDTAGFPFTPNGGDITLQWSADGTLTLRSA